MRRYRVSPLYDDGNDPVAGMGEDTVWLTLNEAIREAKAVIHRREPPSHGVHPGQIACWYAMVERVTAPSLGYMLASGWNVDESFQARYYYPSIPRSLRREAKARERALDAELAQARRR